MVAVKTLTRGHFLARLAEILIDGSIIRSELRIDTVNYIDVRPRVSVGFDISDDLSFYVVSNDGSLPNLEIA